jgi:hypothetical protein
MTKDQTIIRVKVGLLELAKQLGNVSRAGKMMGSEFGSECPGDCGAQDSSSVGDMKRVGRICQQTFIDTYANVAFARLGACP